jgi:hypothetical protein
MVRMAIQCLPFDGLQQYFARQISVDSCQQGRVQDTPVDDGKQGGGPYEPLEVTELARLDTTAAFQHAMPRLNRPASRIPGQSLENIIKRGRWHGTQQHPLERLSAVRGCFFDSLNGKCVKLAQTAGTLLRRPQSHRHATYRQTHCTLRHAAPGGHQQVCMTKRRRGLNGLCIVKEPVRGLQLGGLERVWKRFSRDSLNTSAVAEFVARTRARRAHPTIPTTEQGSLDLSSA